MLYIYHFQLHILPTFNNYSILFLRYIYTSYIVIINKLQPNIYDIYDFT